MYNCGRAGLYLSDSNHQIDNVTIHDSHYGIRGLSLAGTVNITNSVMYNMSNYYFYGVNAANGENITLKHNASEVGKVSYPTVSSMCNVPSSEIILNPYFVSLNASSVSCLNTSANITIYKNDSVPCSYIKYYRKDGFPSSWSDIINNGYMFTPGYHVCDDGTDITTFSVSDWSGYAVYNYTGCVNLSDPSTYMGRVVKDGNDFYIVDNVTLCTDTYSINDDGSEGAIIMNDSDIYLDCNGSTVLGNSLGIGIINDGFNDTMIENCNVSNYSIDYEVIGWSNNTLLLNDTAYYGQAVYIENATYTNISTFDVHHGEGWILEVSYNVKQFNIEHVNIRDSVGTYLMKIYSHTAEHYNISDFSIQNSHGTTADIYLDNADNGTLTNINLTSHDSNPFGGIMILSSDNVTVKDSIVSESNICYNSESSVGLTLDNVTGTNCSDYGFKIYNSDNLTVNNSVFNESDYGVYILGTSQHINMTDCNITYNTYEGLYIENTASNNNFYNTEVCYNHIDTSSWYYDIKDRDTSSFSGMTCDRHYPGSISCSPCGGCVNLSDPSTWGDRIVNVSNTYYINHDTILCDDTYDIPDPGDDGAVVMNASNILLDCNNAILNGTVG